MKPSKKTLGWLTFLLFIFVFFVGFGEISVIDDSTEAIATAFFSTFLCFCSILFFVSFKTLQRTKTPYRKTQTGCLLLAVFFISSSIGLLAACGLGLWGMENRGPLFSYFVTPGFVLALILFIVYLFRKEDLK